MLYVLAVSAFVAARIPRINVVTVNISAVVFAVEDATVASHAVINVVFPSVAVTDPCLFPSVVVVAAVVVLSLLACSFVAAVFVTVVCLSASCPLSCVPGSPLRSCPLI